MRTKQTITIDVELLGKVDSFSNSIKTLQSELSKLSLGKGLTEGFKSSFATITNELEKIQNIAAKKKISVIDDKQIQKSLNTIETAYASVLNKLESEGINTSFLKQDKKAIEALTKASTDFTKQIAKSKKEQDRLNKSLQEALKLQEERHIAWYKAYGYDVEEQPMSKLKGVCPYCMGCNRLENIDFDGVSRCINFVPNQISWEEADRKELKKK